MILYESIECWISSHAAAGCRRSSDNFVFIPTVGGTWTNAGAGGRSSTNNKWLKYTYVSILIYIYIYIERERESMLAGIRSQLLCGKTTIVLPRISPTASPNCLGLLCCLFFFALFSAARKRQIAIEHGPVVDDLPLKNAGFAWQTDGLQDGAPQSCLLV